MKIETRDMRTEEVTVAPATARRPDAGLVRRAALFVTMACTLLVALCWAVNVTNANAKQVSRGLLTLQSRIDQSDSGASSARTSSDGRARSGNTCDGPTLEPVEER